MTTEADYDAFVATGAALFDGRYPGWEATVNLDLLNQYDTRYCVAAQVVCHSADDDAYQGAMDELGFLTFQEAWTHGFCLSRELADERIMELGDDDPAEIYAPLTDAWRRLITSRLAPLEATP